MKHQYNYYEDDLRKRQQEHLNQIRKHLGGACLHDGCTECIGTGVKKMVPGVFI